MRKLILLFFLFAGFVPVAMQAQKITVNARLDSTVMKMGEQTRLSFEVSQRPKQKVIIPVFGDSIKGGLELVEALKADTTKAPDGRILVTHRYVVTSFLDSLLYIPPFPFVADGDTVWSKSLSIKVVQPFKIDTASAKIADIKAVMNPPFDWGRVINAILLGLLISAILFLLWFLYRKYYKKNQTDKVKSPELLLPAYVVALNKLDKIKEEKSWQQGRTKQYHTELTEVLRAYIERVYNISSMEMTSEEIFEELRYLRIEQKSAYLSLQQILNLADLVKFAKFEPSPDENELSLMNAYLFIDKTKVEEVKPMEETKEEGVDNQ